MDRSLADRAEAEPVQDNATLVVTSVPGRFLSAILLRGTRPVTRHPAGRLPAISYRLVDLAQYELLDNLDAIDDAVWHALQGHPDAMEQFQSVWPDVSRQLHPDVVTESREQYLRYAVEQLREASTGETDTVRYLAAIELMILLLDTPVGTRLGD